MCIKWKQTSDQLTISVALQQIEELTDQSLTSVGQWTPYQILTHCAQSVEYSMSGYPQQQPEIWQKTVGKVAFSFFSAKGRMKHPLDEPIPGAPTLENSNQIETALIRLKQAYRDFERYTRPLAPHFTYGSLNKQEYTLVHVMHLNNHLEEIQVS